MSQATERLLHELQTPLETIRHLAESACRPSITEAQRRDRLSDIVAYADLALRITRTARLFSDIAECRAVAPRLQVLEISRMRSAIADLIRDLEVVHKHSRVRGHFECSAHLGLRVLADNDLVVQVLYNVLDNAFRYSFRDKIVEVLLQSSPDSLIISVSNVGLLLTPDDCTHAMQRSWRSAQSKAVHAKGGGNGLWIAQSLLSSLRGEIALSPTDAAGVTVATITIPLHHANTTS